GAACEDAAISISRMPLRGWREAALVTHSRHGIAPPFFDLPDARFGELIPPATGNATPDEGDRLRGGAVRGALRGAHALERADVDVIPQVVGAEMQPAEACDL